MKKPRPSDSEMLDWLSACNKIDHSGQDGGIAFERLIMPDFDGSMACDVRIATRSYGGVDALRQAIIAAMLVDDELGKSSGWSPRRGS